MPSNNKTKEPWWVDDTNDGNHVQGDDNPRSINSNNNSSNIFNYDDHSGDARPKRISSSSNTIHENSSSNSRFNNNRRSSSDRRQHSKCEEPEGRKLLSSSSSNRTSQRHHQQNNDASLVVSLSTSSSSSSTPSTRETFKSWTETGKSKLWNAVEFMNNGNGSSAFRGTSSRSSSNDNCGKRNSSNSSNNGSNALNSRIERSSRRISKSSSSSPTKKLTKYNRLSRNADDYQYDNYHNNNDVDDEFIKWHCEACTFLNVRRRVDIHPKVTLTCEMCCTPYLAPPSSLSTSTRSVEGEEVPFDCSKKQEHYHRSSTRNQNHQTIERNDDERRRRQRSSSKCSSSSGNQLTGRSSRENPMNGRQSSSSISKSRISRSRSRSRSSNSNGDNEKKSSSRGRRSSSSSRIRNSNETEGGGDRSSIQHYSMSELIKCLNCVDSHDNKSNSNSDSNNNEIVALPPALERRVQDFKFAQRKRREKYGEYQRPWGIYGLYSHLSDIRADLEWAEDAAWRRQRKEPYLSWKDFDKLSHDSRTGGRRLVRYGNIPIFTYTVMFLCTIMMFVTLGVNGWKFEPIHINPLIGPSHETLIKCGARDTNLIVNENQWYRLFTPMILHAGIIHYLVNMLALFFIGGAVEKAHGFVSTAVFFIIPAVGGNILSAIFLPGFISVGASGGIFGLIGGCMADICLNWKLLFLKTGSSSSLSNDENDDDNDSDNDNNHNHNTISRQHFCVLLWLAIDIIINTLIGFTPFVDNFTHLGGFIYGFFIGFASIETLASGFFGIRSSSQLKGGNSRWSKILNAVFRYFGLILSVVVIMVTTVILINSDGVTNPCHGCRYISCVPFPPNSDDKWWYCDDCDVVAADLFRSTTVVLNLNDDDYFNGFVTDDDVIPIHDTARTNTENHRSAPADASSAPAGLGLYEQVNIYCPNGDVEEIDISNDGIYETDKLRRELPSYCRAHCDDVFATSN